MPNYRVCIRREKVTDTDDTQKPARKRSPTRQDERRHSPRGGIEEPRTVDKYKRTPRQPLIRDTKRAKPLRRPEKQYEMVRRKPEKQNEKIKPHKVLVRPAKKPAPARVVVQPKPRPEKSKPRPEQRKTIRKEEKKVVTPSGERITHKVTTEEVVTRL